MVITDEELLVAARGGRDTQAFEELYNRYSKHLLKFAWFVICDRDRAEDLVQEVFLRIFQNKVSWAGGSGTFRPWLFAVARDWMRQRHANDLSAEVEKRLRQFARSLSQFLEGRLAAMVKFLVDASRAVRSFAFYSPAYRSWFSLHIDHPPKDLFQAAAWSVQLSGRCVPGQV